MYVNMKHVEVSWRRRLSEGSRKPPTQMLVEALGPENSGTDADGHKTRAPTSP